MPKIVMPKILLISSLSSSILNNHVISGIKNGFEFFLDFIKVDFKKTEEILSMNSLKGVDLLLYVGSTIAEDNPLRTIAALAKNQGVTSVFWATDDPYEFDARYRTEGFDIYFSNDKNAAINYFERPKVYHLPLAASINCYRKLLSFDHRNYGVSFCGYPYSNRKMFIKDMIEYSNFNSDDLVVIGPEWNIDGLSNFVTQLNHNSLIDIYSQSRFVLNLGRHFNIANQYKKLVSTTPGPRTFECGLAGTPQFYLGSIEIEEYYIPEKEIVVVESVTELSERYYWYCKNIEDWRRLAADCQRRTFRDHLYQNRILLLLTKIKDEGVIDVPIDKMNLFLAKYLRDKWEIS
ncbi:CgeB family protein [Limnospira platensis]|uniref:CgeB family protein n=1 Tax=Limnospira platensis TaxID=118562 RepID=UPI0002803DEF|nr:hypothetical protein SPLC1_S131710 [Arthrospira platensis C1]UWU51541.1 spore maturation protein CgeB [Arthrospira platensis C1]